MITLGLDFDGTLTTIENRQVSLLKAICGSYGISLQNVPVWELKRSGKSNVDVLTKWGLQNNIAKKIQADWINQVENSYWLGMDRLQPRSIDFLNKLKLKGIKTFLISARQSKLALDNQLLKLNISDYFDGVFCVNPSNAIFEKSVILSNLGAHFFIGDTESDFQAAKIADNRFIGVTSGQRSFEFLRSKGVEMLQSDAYGCLQFF